MAGYSCNSKHQYIKQSCISYTICNTCQPEGHNISTAIKESSRDIKVDFSNDRSDDCIKEVVKPVIFTKYHEDECLSYIFDEDIIDAIDDPVADIQDNCVSADDSCTY